MTSPLLAPVAVLVLWSVIVMFWVMVTRFPAFKKAGIDLASAPPGGRYQHPLGERLDIQSLTFDLPRCPAA